MISYAKRVAALLLSAALASAFSGCYLLPQEEDQLQPPLARPVQVEYKTQPVERGSLSIEVNATGYVVSGSQASLSFEKAAGRLKAIHKRSGDFVKKGELIAELESASIELDVKLMEISLEAAEYNLEYQRLMGADKYARTLMEYDIEKLRLQLESMYEQLEMTRLVSTIDGQIVYTTTTNIGEYINAYDIIAKVADLDDLIVAIEPSNEKISGIPTGAGVAITYGDYEVTGDIVQNSVYDSYVNDSVLIAVPREKFPEDVKLGLTASVKYISEQREDIIVVARQRINLVSGRRFVNILEDGIRVERDVEIGIQSDTMTEIVNGLEEGDLIIVG